MRISTITNWAYGATVVLTALSGTAFILSERAANAERAAVQQHLTLDDLGEQLAIGAELRTDAARLYVMRTAPRHLAEYRREEREEHSREQAIESIRRQEIVPAEAEAIRDAESALDPLDRLELGALAAMERGDQATAQEILFGPEHERLQAEVLEPIDRFRELVAARTTAQLSQAHGTSDAWRLVARILLGITAGLFLCVLNFVLLRRVSLPLTRMTRIVTRLAGNDYAVEVPVDRRRDEIGDMTQAIHVFRDSGLERDRLDAERRADQRVKDLILQMMHRLQACNAQAELAEVVACFAPQIFPGLAGRLYVLDENHSALTPAAGWLDPQIASAPFSPNACWGLRRGRPHISNRGHSDVPCLHIGEQDWSSLCVPLTAQGDTVGLLYFEERPGMTTAADEAHRLYLELLAENIGLALANLRLRERLTNFAIKDMLTGLLNRRSLDETLNRCARLAEAPVLACLMIDIDHFKRFNDSFGHDAGDAVMEHFAHLLSDTLGDKGTAYRFGGEEFTVLLPGAGEEAGYAWAEQLRARIATTPLSHRGRMLGNVTISIGVAAAPGDGPVATLIGRADAALLEAKAAGRDRTVIATELGASGAEKRIA